MSAEILRKAASLMRERAEAATPGPWIPFDADADHIASWHPAVALAVADWLDATADDWDRSTAPIPVSDIRLDARAALAVARAYLGSDE